MNNSNHYEKRIGKRNYPDSFNFWGTIDSLAVLATRILSRVLAEKERSPHTI